MYKKVKKTFVNPYGIETVADDKNPFMGPCLLCLMPDTLGKKGLNGYLSKFIKLLGLRHNSSFNSGYDISQVPFSMLIDGDFSSSATQILNLIPKNDIEAAKDVLKNINIVCYCSGNQVTLSLINSLYDGLISKGYSKEEIEEILSQIFVIQIVDNLKDDDYNDTRFPYVTTVTFHNIHDLENVTWAQKWSDSLFSKESFSRIGIEPISAKNMVILYDSFGEGSLRETGGEHNFEQDYYNSPVLNTLISIFLINALRTSCYGEKRDLQHFLEYFGEILKKAHEYEKSSKPLEEFSKNDLASFNEHMAKIVVEYLKNNFKFNELDEHMLELDDECIKTINDFLRQGKYGFFTKITVLQAIINQIINYYLNYDKNDTEMITVGINANFQVPCTIERIIQMKLHDMLKKLQEIIKDLQELTPSHDASSELYEEIEKAKTTILNSLFNPTIIEIMNEYNVGIIGISQYSGKRK